MNTLTTICYQDRAPVYESWIHKLDTEGKLAPLKSLFAAASSICPTRINRNKAEGIVEAETLQWFFDNDVLLTISVDEYSLSDEFLRIRMIMDEDIDRASEVERRVLNLGYEDVDMPDVEEWRPDWQEKDEYDEFE